MLTFVFFFSFSKESTFKPKKSFAKGTKRYELHKHAKATLGSGNLRQAVVLPEREDINEWLAVNSKFLFLLNKKFYSFF